MQIRLIGTPAELESMVKRIREQYEILSISRLYPCRNEPNHSRQYITVKEREPLENA